MSGVGAPARVSGAHYARMTNEKDGMAMTATLDKQELAAPVPPPIRDVSPEEVVSILDRRAQRYLGISGQEFLRRWRSGYYAADPDQSGVLDVAMLVPFIPEDIGA